MYKMSSFTLPPRLDKTYTVEEMIELIKKGRTAKPSISMVKDNIVEINLTSIFMLYGWVGQSYILSVIHTLLIRNQIENVVLKHKSGTGGLVVNFKFI